MSIRACVRVLLFATPFPLATLHAQALGAQLLGRVFLADSVTGIAGIVVVASNAAGREIARALTDERGGYLLPVPRPARYEIGALRVGFQPTVLPPVTLAAGETLALDIVLSDVAERVGVPEHASETTLPQQPKMQGAGAVFAGRVTQAGDSAVLVPGAEVQLVGTGMSHYADNHARFTFTGVPQGRYELRVHRLGYQPLVDSVSVADGRLYEYEAELRRIAHALTEVRIEGRIVKVPARYEEPYRRASLGFGTFFTREQIERRNPMDVQALLMEIPGVAVRAGRGRKQKIEFSGCAQGGKVQVYIDGNRATRFPPPTGGGGGYSGAPVDWDSVESVLETVPPTSIQIIEVYHHTVEIPAQFLDDACAVIAIWTKAY